MSDNVMSIHFDWPPLIRQMLDAGHGVLIVPSGITPTVSQPEQKQEAGGISSRPEPLPEPPDGTTPTHRQAWALYQVLIDGQVIAKQVREYFGFKPNNPESARSDLAELCQVRALQRIGDNKAARYVKTERTETIYLQLCKELG